MENQSFNGLTEISDADGETTPENVKRLVGQLLARIAALKERQQHLEEPLPRNSQNSSQPPSQAVPQGFKAQPKAAGKRDGAVNSVMTGTRSSCMPGKNVRRLRRITLTIVVLVGRF